MEDIGWMEYSWPQGMEPSHLVDISETQFSRALKVSFLLAIVANILASRED